MAGDPRVAVAVGLRRLVEAGSWPTESLVTFQNLLLDEAGGDTRPLVGLLLRAVEQGVPEDLVAALPSEWEQRRPLFVSRLISNAFVQPEMARWAVHAWAHAFGLEAEPALIIPPPPPLERVAPAVAVPRWTARPAPIAFTPGLQTSRGPVARHAPLTTWAPTPGPLSAQDRRRDRITIAVFALALAGTLVPTAVAVLNRPKDAAPVTRPATVASAAASPVPAPLPVRAADGAFSGRYRVERTLESITGDPSCSDGAAAVHWPVPSTEVVAHDSLHGTFQFLTRPEVRGRVTPAGDLIVGPVFGEQGGVSYTFRMEGHFTPGGFEARAATATRTMLAWLKVEECHLSGRLSGRRVE